MVHTTRIPYRFRDSAFTSGFQHGETFVHRYYRAAKRDKENGS
eukprot:UN28305